MVESRKSMIGEALVKEGAITEKLLQRALKVQARLEQPKQLGEVLIDMGYATRQAIADVVAKYGKTMRIGDMLVEQGLVSPENIETACSVQKERKQPLGRILIDLGYINERTLLQNLASQAQVQYIEPSLAMIDPSLLKGTSPGFLETNMFVPFHKEEDDTVVVIVPELDDPDRTHVLEEIYRDRFVIALGPEENIRKTIEEFAKFRARPSRTKGRASDSDEDSVITLVDHIFEQAIKERASDIHIEPMGDRVRLRYRMDGVLVFKTDLPKTVMKKIVSRIKVMASLDISENRLHQGGRINYEMDGVDYDLRVSTYVTIHGICVVLRVLNKQVGLVGLDELGMNASMLSRFRTEVLDPPTGIVIITGPTGSGKTTSLYSALDYCNVIDCKIITVEDPVEFVIDGIIQCSVYEKIGRTFETSLREIVRQDPDIIVLGEIRDKTTALTAIQAALTGHKVYSTFHTEDSIGGLVRLMNMEIEAFLISSTVISVVAQRLLRRICENCAVPYIPNPEELRKLDVDFAEARTYEYRKGQGCNQCNYTGYRGRIGAYEMLVMNDAVKEALLEGAPAHVIRRISTDSTGLISMREDALAKVIRGQTTFEEVLKHTPKTIGMRDLPQILTMTQ